jgi:cupin superfamily acireductone dioxygenase involved in methionine salvage|tara:strand:- start:5 stop:325 length:321 start_codon:yes stop_codon:yes gene_type:complete
MNKENTIRRLIKKSLRKNTNLNSNQFEIQKTKYHEQANHGELEGQVHDAFYINIENVVAEEGWSTDDVIKVADNIKVEILRYADEKNIMIKVHPFVDAHDEIMVLY